MPDRKPITKAVIAAAGFGTRFLPQTKAMPKEMLPVVDKPIVQYVVEELVDAGIQDIIIVTGYHKRSIEDHFDNISADLRKNLKDSGKLELLDEVKKISTLANFAYVRQKGPYGNATPLLNAEHLIGDEAFIFAWADDFVKAEPSRFKQLLAVYNERGGSILTCLRSKSEEDYNRYAFISGQNVDDSLIKVDRIVEKPGKNREGLSDFASLGGYVFEPSLFKYLHQELEDLKPEAEFIMQPALQRMIEDGHSFYGCEVTGGKFYDTGNKLEYLKTVVDFALMNDDLKDDFKEHLRSVIN